MYIYIVSENLSQDAYSEYCLPFGEKKSKKRFRKSLTDESDFLLCLFRLLYDR